MFNEETIQKDVGRVKRMKRGLGSGMVTLPGLKGQRKGAVTET